MLNAIGNIFQFVGYARDVYVQVREIRTSAMRLTSEEQNIACSASELQGLVDKVLNDITPVRGANSSASDKKIRELGLECQRLSQELVDRMNSKGTRSRSNVFSAAKSVLLGTWKLSEVDKSLKELDSLQDNLFKHLLAHMR